MFKAVNIHKQLKKLKAIGKEQFTVNIAKNQTTVNKAKLPVHPDCYVCHELFLGLG